jgi:hypothetical protein
LAQTTTSAAALRAAADRLLRQVEHYGPERWAAHGRGDTVFALVQLLADLGAAAEGRAARAVPRLGKDLALPDQLRVMVADLLAVPTADCEKAEAAITATLAALAGAG